MTDEDDLASSSRPPQQRSLGQASRSGDMPDEVRSSGTSSTAKPPAEAAGEFTTVEVAGDPPPQERGEAEREVGNEEVIADSESASNFTEASPAQLAAAESGEESAVSDLRGIEGFEESTSTGTEATATETALAEAGAVANGETPEFLPFLAALIPTLVSSVGPMIAKGISGALSPKAQKAIGRLPVRSPAAARSQPANLSALLAQIAQLLNTMKTRPGSESGMEASDESVVSEAVAVLETILGVDDRVRIQRASDIPWRRICALRITFPSGAVYRGTGFLIGPRAVATAGHCVYLHDQGGWARRVEVIPGINGSTRTYGSAESSQLRSVGGWVNGKRPQSDYGCIVLPQGSFGGRNLGSFSISAMTAEALVAKPAVLAGYPGDKPFAELWGMARKIKTVGPDTLIYEIDTMGGQSGAPVYIKRNGVRTVVGIHNYGSSTGNSATRVTSAVAQRLMAWSQL